MLGTDEQNERSKSLEYLNNSSSGEISLRKGNTLSKTKQTVKFRDHNFNSTNEVNFFHERLKNSTTVLDGQLKRRREMVAKKEKVFLKMLPRVDSKAQQRSRLQSR